jgi:peptidoglycan/LPS O-acetylase OafA/YrhL
MQTVGFSLIALVMGGIVASVLAADPATPVARFLRRPMLANVGKHSYAMYLLHVPIDYAVQRAGIAPHGVAALGVIAGEVLATYALSLVTWRLVESPCLELKRYFRYDTKIVLLEASSAVA